jgi:UDP-N-acetylmuramate dehydrogenase
VKFARGRGLPHVVLGRGSNVVISDAGVRGLVIQNRAEGATITDDRLVAESGLPMARAATDTQKAGLTGLEFGLAIPGTVGGAVWANAGAHGADVAGVLESASVLLADGTEQRLAGPDLDLSYRHSRFTGGAGAGELVVAATFALRQASADEIRRWRQAHQPLGIPSAGSFFRNPPGGPSAGALIERAGLKGLREGGASVSPKHANFLVNDQQGTASDVRRLGERVRVLVERATGVRLEWEIVFLGDWSGWEEEG